MYQTGSFVLIGLEVFQVFFLLLHDWLPMGRLNDVAAQRRTDSFSKRLWITVLSALPYLVLLLSSLQHAAAHALPGSLLAWLWIGYGLLFLGELRAWWIPYAVQPDPERAARYRTLFGNTHAFLPERNGIRPNTLHAALHAATLLTLVCLALLSWSR